MLKVLLFALILCNQTQARPPEEAELAAAAHIAESMADWISGLREPPESVLIYSVNSHEPFDQDFSNIMEIEVMKYLAEEGITKVTACLECRIPQVTVEQSHIIISKGAPDVETVKRVAARYPVQSLLMIEIYRTKLNVVVHGILYSNPDGNLLSTERFKVPAITVSDSAVQFLLTFGSGAAFFQGTAPTGTGLTGSGNLALLEEIGFGKGGLNVGAIIVPGQTLIHLDPTLGLRGRVGTSTLRWGVDLGIGYGMVSGVQGFVGRLALQVFLGSIAVIGLDGTYFLRTGTATADHLTSYAGAHIGFAIGR